MNPRSLEQILSELSTSYDPQVNSVRQRQQLIPGQIVAEEAGLQAKQGQAYEDIISGARRRGLGFSGVPLGEQAKYAATEYLPALARLRQSGQEQAMSLEDAILQINERKNTLAQQIYQQEQDRAAQQRAASAAASQNAGLASLFSGLGNAGQQAQQRASLESIFGVGGNSAPALRVAQPKNQANLLQNAGGLSLQNPLSLSNAYTGVLQGTGANMPRLAAPKTTSSGLKVAAPTTRKVTVR